MSSVITRRITYKMLITAYILSPFVTDENIKYDVSMYYTDVYKRQVQPSENVKLPVYSLATLQYNSLYYLTTRFLQTNASLFCCRLTKRLYLTFNQPYFYM